MSSNTERSCSTRLSRRFNLDRVVATSTERSAAADTPKESSPPVVPTDWLSALTETPTPSLPPVNGSQHSETGSSRSEVGSGTWHSSLQPAKRREAPQVAQ